MYAHKNLNKTYRLLHLVRRVEQVELRHPTEKVNEIEIQYTMKQKLRSAQVIDTIRSIN